MVRVSEAAKVACWRSRFAAASALLLDERASARRALPSSVAARLARVPQHGAEGPRRRVPPRLQREGAAEGGTATPAST